jgi:hypothetical protein
MFETHTWWLSLTQYLSLNVCAMFETHTWWLSLTQYLSLNVCAMFETHVVAQLNTVPVP